MAATDVNTTLSPRKLPRQSRSLSTVNAILDATAHILVEQGIKAASTNAVAERAGVSVGSLYQYFPNKDALISALHARHADQMMAVIQGALTQAMDATLDDALAGLVEATVEAHRVDADLHRVLEQHLGDHSHHARHAEYVDVMEGRIEALLARHRDEITVPNLRLAAYMLTNAAHPLIHAVIGERPRGVSLKQGSREIAQMLKGYLICPRMA